MKFLILSAALLLSAAAAVAQTPLRITQAFSNPQMNSFPIADMTVPKTTVYELQKATEDFFQITLYQGNIVTSRCELDDVDMSFEWQGLDDRGDLAITVPTTLNTKVDLVAGYNWQLKVEITDFNSCQWLQYSFLAFKEKVDPSDYPDDGLVR